MSDRPANVLTNASARVAAIGVRGFSSESHAERARRPTDFLLLALSLLGVAFATYAKDQAPALSAAITSFVKATPGLFGWFWEASFSALVVWALVLIVAPVFARGRLSLLRDQLIALAVTTFAMMGLLDSGDLMTAVFGSGPPPRFPAVRLALAVAVIATTSPHLSRPFKRIGRWVMGLGAAAAVSLGVALPIGIVGGLAAGLAATAIVHLIFGSPGGRPSLEAVAGSLRELGVEAKELEHVGLAARGAALVRGADDSGPLWIKVFGRDAWGGQLMAKVWDTLWYRNAAESSGTGPQQQVQREAFVTLLAEHRGVPVPTVVAAGVSSIGDALLVTRPLGTPLAEVPIEAVTDSYLGSAWSAHKDLAELKLAHGQFDSDHLLLLQGGGAAVRDFSLASSAAPPQLLMRDRAQLLVTTYLLVGAERAVGAALRALGEEALGETVPFLQRVAMTPPTKEALAGRDLKDLRQAASDAVGIPLPKLEHLRRVTWGSLLLAATLILAAYFVISAISGVGLESLLKEIEQADQGWLWAALIVGVLAQVGQAFSTMGAAIMPIRFSAALALQLAIQFLALAVPSSAARISLNVRFFQRNGATTEAALAIGAIDSVSGFLVQVMVLLIVLISGAFTLELQLDSGSGSGSGSGASTLIILVVVFAVVSVAVLLAVPKYRRLLKEKVVAAGAQLRVLRSPRKLLMLFGGNFMGQVLLAAALGCCLRAFGERLPLAELLFINTLVALFSGIMPVPGGIGVTEAATSACLTAAGIPSTIALPTAILFRVMTFYLPPIWGGFAARWLRRHEYL